MKIHVLIAKSKFRCNVTTGEVQSKLYIEKRNQQKLIQQQWFDMNIVFVYLMLS